MRTGLVCVEGDREGETEEHLSPILRGVVAMVEGWAANERHYGRAPSSPTGRADVLAGMSQLPDGCGVAVRLLGAHVEDCADRICLMFG